MNENTTGTSPESGPKPTPDITIENSGGMGFFIFTAITDAGREWLQENVDDFGSYMIDVAACDSSSMAWSIYQGALEDGLLVE